ncbi:hypothetical protein CRG98_046881 [Punica granatum]|uniref:Uncharacterized protein n=1 Tax=Punica granatum TaxID=22663 RepID=A0A2I0HM16_PUNGR|nr:hypothetical protein CRG98_046881 [Punica granatum]
MREFKRALAVFVRSPAGIFRPRSIAYSLPDKQGGEKNNNKQKSKLVTNQTRPSTSYLRMNTRDSWMKGFHGLTVAAQGALAEPIASKQGVIREGKQGLIREGKGSVKEVRSKFPSFREGGREEGATMPEQPVTCDESGTSVYVVYFHPTHLAPKDLKTESLYTIHAFPVTHPPHEPLPQQPVLTLRPRDLPIEMGFGCIGSSIYMIGGSWCLPSPRKEDPSLDVYILDTRLLPPATSHPVENPLAYLRKGPSLRAPKIEPFVISLLGKLYVLPKSFAPSSSSDKDEPRAEVFDPCSNEWVSLPEPELDPHDFCEPSDYEVQSCSAMGSCIVLMLGCSLQIYELDCNHPCEGWKKSSRFGWLPEVQQTRGSEVVDGLCKNTDLMTRGYGKLRFTFDVVRLEKKTSADERKRKQRGDPKGRCINCVLLGSFSYVAGEVGSGGYLYGCFPM